MKKLLIVIFALSIFTPWSFAADKDKTDTTAVDAAPKVETKSTEVATPTKAETSTKAETPAQVEKTVATTDKK